MISALEQAQPRRGETRDSVGSVAGPPAALESSRCREAPGALCSSLTSTRIRTRPAAPGEKRGTAHALRNGTGVLTPRGYIPIEELLVGGRVIGANGTATRVVGVYPQVEQEVLEVVFSDRSVIETSETHLWNVRVGTKPWRVQTSAQVEASIASGHQRPAVPTMQRATFAERHDITYGAYQLGLLLGDGSFRGKGVQFTTPDVELAAAFGDQASKWTADYAYGIRRTKQVIERLGLWGLKSRDKFVPEEYLWASATHRLAMLQGLLDTDGHATKVGGAEYGSTSFHLAEGVQHLAETLGGHAHWSTREIESGTFYRLSVVMPPEAPPFRLERKLNQWKPRTKYQPTRTIVDVRRTGVLAPMTCIAVESPDSLFVTDGCIVTHNCSR